MATQVQNSAQPIQNRTSQRVLQIDGLFELVLGISLILDASTIAKWLGISDSLALEAGVAVAIVGLGLLALTRQMVSYPVVRAIAIANIVFAIGCGAVLLIDWNTFANEGRWLIGFVADVLLMLGAVELYSVRASQ